MDPPLSRGPPITSWFEIGPAKTAVAGAAEGTMLPSDERPEVADGNTDDSDGDDVLGNGCDGCDPAVDCGSIRVIDEGAVPIVEMSLYT